MSGYVEKRDYHRMQVDAAVDYRAGDSVKAASGRMLNLSAVGVQFTSSDAFEIGTRLTLTIHGGNEGEALSGEATVLRCEPQSEGYQVACSFSVDE